MVGHAPEPNHDDDMSLAAMWKFTGRSNSVHTSHMGFQWGSLRSGRPAVEWGSELVLMPFMPIFWQRLISATASFTSHHGTRIMGKMRLPDCSCSSAMASL